MLLIEGISVFQPITLFDNTEEYCTYLLSLNEQVSWLLRLKDDSMKEHLQSHSLSQSLSLFTLSVLHLLSQESTDPREEVEEWRRDYLQLMESELVNRTLRLAARILQLNAPPLLRLIDLPKWFSVFEILIKSGRFSEKNDGFIMSFIFEECFRRNKVFKKNMEIILIHFSAKEKEVSNLSYSQLYIMSASFASWRRTVLGMSEDSTSLLNNLVLCASQRSDPTEIISIFKVFLWGFPELGDSSFCNKVASKLVEVKKEMLVDILKQVNLNTLAQSITLAISTAENVTLLQSAFDKKLSLEEAKDLLQSSDGNLSAALSKGKTLVDSDKYRTNKLLNDKSFVIANMSKYQKTLLEEEDNMYEDEYVDSYDGDGPTPTAPRNINTTKTADNLSGDDDVLIKEYIKNPKTFGRSADIRRSKERVALLNRLKMSHEQLEGWAILLERNPRKNALLADYALLYPQNA